MWPISFCSHFLWLISSPNLTYVDSLLYATSQDIGISYAKSVYFYLAYINMFLTFDSNYAFFQKGLYLFGLVLPQGKS